ncbi:cation transporting ATPase C-terminal domain-containing protein [Actinomadura sp. RB99]|uniref:cation transporting ATPase C-terminal domain-containing protein n=1 Tax=Actinomadura sp. RB99 TaxID=2691577 RepID=UPI0016864E0A|nr:cation transporting ATPase C-terminal domain-containing protein [Actinomadura sp. RB99]
MFICRSLTGPAWRIRPLSNRWIIPGVTAQAISQLAVTYLPAMNTIFNTAPIGWQVRLRILAIAIAASLMVAIDKRLHHRRG